MGCKRLAVIIKGRLVVGIMLRLRNGHGRATSRRGIRWSLTLRWWRHGLKSSGKSTYESKSQNRIHQSYCSLHSTKFFHITYQRDTVGNESLGAVAGFPDCKPLSIRMSTGSVESLADKHWEVAERVGKEDDYSRPEESEMAGDVIQVADWDNLGVDLAAG
jgi:hypothetical protein